jgi:hypothetical protein
MCSVYHRYPRTAARQWRNNHYDRTLRSLEIDARGVQARSLTELPLTTPAEPRSGDSVPQMQPSPQADASTTLESGSEHG